MKRKIVKIVLIIIISIIVLARVALPYVVEDRFNEFVAANPDISGGISDVDIWLLSGRASLHNLIINKAVGNIPAPLISANKVAFSISWKDLFRGRFFGDIELTQPLLNIVDAKQEKNTQTGAEIDWRQALEGLYPFEINRIYIEDGEVHFRNFESEPPVDIYLQALELEANNITNEITVEDSRAASVKLTAKTIGKGEVEFNSQFNLLREPATGTLEISIEDLNLNSLNDFAKAYANLDVQSGLFSATGKLLLKESDEISDIDGEVNPIIENLNVLRWQQDVEVQQDSAFTVAWEGSIDIVKWLLEVGPEDKISTSIPITGTVENPNIGVMSAIYGAIKNALLSTITTGDGKEVPVGEENDSVGNESNEN